MLLVFYNNGARASELEEQIFVMPNCPELEEGVFIASAQNPTVGHLSSSASVEEPGRPDAPPDQPACGPVDRARRRPFSVKSRLRPASGPVWTGPIRCSIRCAGPPAGHFSVKLRWSLASGPVWTGRPGEPPGRPGQAPDGPVPHPVRPAGTPTSTQKMGGLLFPSCSIDTPEFFDGLKT